MATQPDFAKLEEMITCRATANGERVTGISGNIGYNLSLLSNWAKGNLHGHPQVSSRDARQFLGAVRYAHDEAEFTGRRNAFHCAEVNAVVKLLDRGAGLRDIRLYRAKGDQKQWVGYCRACTQWIYDLNIETIDSI
ncbi:hypothetical protein [Sphingomonas sp. dw_22]|uniref:hypothetical protein n=1 Tax=Sphingomonas sp. dw_22 TaxID=2721175 RepID=UPI001BD5BC6E|nr:hypothetical protein [Sphingomonas sp. dw_22]